MIRLVLKAKRNKMWAPEEFFFLLLTLKGSVSILTDVILFAYDSKTSFFIVTLLIWNKGLNKKKRERDRKCFFSRTQASLTAYMLIMTDNRLAVFLPSLVWFKATIWSYKWEKILFWCYWNLFSVADHFLYSKCYA